GAATMQKDPNLTDSPPASYALIAGTIHMPGPDDDVRDPESLAIFGDACVRFDVCEAIGVPPELGTVVNRARRIQQPPPRFLRVGIDRERTDADESPQACVPQACFEKITRRDNRVHERIGKRLLASARGQVKDDRHILGRSDAILAGQKIAFDHLNSCPAAAASDGFDSSHFTGGPGKTAQVAEPTIQQILQDSGPNETGCPCDQDRIVRADYKSIAFHLARISPLIGDVWRPYRVDAQDSKESS